MPDSDESPDTGASASSAEVCCVQAEPSAEVSTSASPPTLPFATATVIVSLAASAFTICEVALAMPVSLVQLTPSLELAATGSLLGYTEPVATKPEAVSVTAVSVTPVKSLPPGCAVHVEPSG